MDPRRLERILRQHLKTDALLGVEAVPRGEATPVVIAEPVPTAAPAASPEPPRAADRPPADAAEPSGRPPARSGPPPGRLDREAKLEVLRRMDEDEVKGCTKCGLCHSRTQTVFGEGDPDAPIMFIGEGPGQDEDEQGRPFVGRSGKLLDKMINAMGFSREQVFIANVVKCRPPNNRAPTAMEADACWGYLRRQIETVRPVAIVTLGGPAAKLVLSTKEGVTRLRGRWHAYDPQGLNVPVMPTFHPAYLLRAYTTENRKRVWSDLKQVMEKVEKQG